MSIAYLWIHNFYFLIISCNSFLKFIVDFDNKQTSLQVGGGLNGTTRCCWGVYSEPDFKGDFLHFRFAPYGKGLYKSAQDMGKLFRAASSIQLLNENCNEPYYS